MNKTDANEADKSISEFFKKYNIDNLNHIRKVHNYLCSLTKKNVLKENGIINRNNNEIYSDDFYNLNMFYKIHIYLEYMELHYDSIYVNWQDAIIFLKKYVIDQMFKIMESLNFTRNIFSTQQFFLKSLVEDKKFNYDYIIHNEYHRNIFRDLLQKMKNYKRNIETDTDYENY